MSTAPTLPGLLERWFTERLLQHRQVSPNTVASYRDTFRLLLVFAQKQLGKAPSSLNLQDIDAPLVSAFLDDLETHRSISARTRNLRLTAIRSFFRFVSFEDPAHSAHIQRVLAIPGKLYDKKTVAFLTRTEIDALLSAPDRSTWIGCRDHALMLLAVQTGLRLSELIGLNRCSVKLGKAAHVRCFGKGRKERCTPITRTVNTVMQAWLIKPYKPDSKALFQTLHGGRLSGDAVQYLVAKYATLARENCPSLRHKRVTPHVLRHSAAMELLQAGVDCSVIALWLGHESVDTTQMYLHAHMALKESALAKVTPLKAEDGMRFQADDELLQFLSSL